jgi:hypothetical protein
MIEIASSDTIQLRCMLLPRHWLIVEGIFYHTIRWLECASEAGAPLQENKTPNDFVPIESKILVLMISETSFFFFTFFQMDH